MNAASLVQRKLESVPPTLSCQEAARRMRDTGVGSLVVVENGRPLGVVTDRDLVLREHAVRRLPVVDDDQELIGVIALDDVILSLASGLAAVAETIRKEM